MLKFAVQYSISYDTFLDECIKLDEGAANMKQYKIFVFNFIDKNRP
jgi:hypothetical protein